MPSSMKAKGLASRRTRVLAIEQLFARDDVERPRLLTPKDRLALRATLWLAVECEAEFERLRRGRRLSRTYEVDYLCDSIRGTLDAVDDIKALGRIVTGVSVTHPIVGASSLPSLLREHGRLYKSLVVSRRDLAARLSALIKLTQIELIFLGHMW